MASLLVSSPDTRPVAVDVPVTWPTMGGWLNLPKKVRAVRLGNADREPIVILGGISATAEVAWRLNGKAGWWWDLVDALKLLDRYSVVGIDYAADETGEYAPSPNEQSAIINAALSAFGAPKPYAVIGASYGGMVALNWAAKARNGGTKLVIISADASPHPFATALRSIQRRLVALGRDAGNPEAGLILARALAMVGYRTPQEFRARFRGGLGGHHPLGPTDVFDYLGSRGEEFAQRFSEGRFLSLSASIDRQNVNPGELASPALLIGVHEDQLVPPCQLEELKQKWLGPCDLRLFHSPYGHDAFLKEVPAIAPLIRGFLKGDPQ